MRTTLKIIIFLFAVFLMNCGGKEEKKKNTIIYGKKDATEKPISTNSEKVQASLKVDLTNKGVGPITLLVLPESIDETMAAHGADIYKKMCTACHRPDKKCIGPAPLGILERRSPEWIMNMILNPENMIQNDPLAKELLSEFNGAPMANQNLTEDEARAILEYFRTLK